MAAAAGEQPLIHYRDMAYMGFIEVAKHLRRILGFMARTKEQIGQYGPDAVILIDYPSFNLKIAHFAHEAGIPAYYFISPKVWAWKEYRVKEIKRFVRRVFSILPFEVDFYRKHDYEVDYVGNPTVGEIDQTISGFSTCEDFCRRNNLPADQPIIALVPGSRKKEIRDNLPTMMSAAQSLTGYRPVVAAAPNISMELYSGILGDSGIPVVSGQTFELVYHARVAAVTSGTATLETALLGTPQVACYRMNGSKWVYRFYRRLIKGKYVTLPNLITDSPLIPELLLHNCTHETVLGLLRQLSTDSPRREAMRRGYSRLREILGDSDCAPTTAQKIIADLRNRVITA